MDNRERSIRVKKRLRSAWLLPLRPRHPVALTADSRPPASQGRLLAALFDIPPDVPVRGDVHPVSLGEIVLTGVARPVPVAVIVQFAVAGGVGGRLDDAEQVPVLAAHAGFGFALFAGEG